MLDKLHIGGTIAPRLHLGLNSENFGWKLRRPGMLNHEISEGFIRKVGRNYFMVLTVDGQRQQRKTGTNDEEKAYRMLEDWKSQVRTGVIEETRLRYEAMRDEYIQKGGKSVQASVLRDLDTYFKNIRVSAITVKKLDEFRTWRENLPQVV